MTSIACLILLVLGLILYVLWQIATDLRTILRESLPEIPTIQKTKPVVPGPGVWHRPRHTGQPQHVIGEKTPLGTFMVWVWRDGQWHPQPVPYGIRPGLPPSYAGAFTGDMAKTWVTNQQ